MNGMVPGEIRHGDGDLELNSGRRTRSIVVMNTGDRPIQVGSHFHFADVNAALDFDRTQAHGFRLAVPAGTAVRFEPGASREVEVVELGGLKRVPGLQLRSRESAAGTEGRP